MIKLAENLSLPVDCVTQTISILAIKRAGKSYTMRRLAEQLFKAGQQIILVDPKGDQWGLRSSADGKKAGLPVIVLGGEHGDVPLEVGSGEMIANLAVKERASILIDLSIFRKHEIATFMTAFLENLYRLKAREEYRTPVMLIIDEADAIASQKPQKGEERMLGAAEDIVRRGGQRGIGCTLVTQRSAVLNKNVLTQTQIMVCLRTIAPQDLEAMNAWIVQHGTEEQKQTLMASLPSLPIGDAWFWSPGWPDAEGIFKRVHVAPIETFDSGRTPKPGEKRVEPKNLADIDIEVLKRQMKDLVVRAKENDPAELRKKIRELEKQLKGDGGLKATVAVKVDGEKMIREYGIKVNALLEEYKKKRDDHIGICIKKLNEIANAIVEAGNMLRFVPGKPSIPSMGTTAEIKLPLAKPSSSSTKVYVKQVNSIATMSNTLSSVEQRIVDTVKMLNNRGIEVTRDAIARWMGIHPTGGRFTSALASLRANSILEGFRLTAAGTAMAAELETGPEKAIEALQEDAKKKVLREILESGAPLTKDELAARLGVHPTGGRFTSTLAWLRDMGLIPERGLIEPTEGCRR